LLGISPWWQGCADLASNAQHEAKNPELPVVNGPAETPAVTQKPTGDGQVTAPGLAVADGGNRFAFDLYQQLRNESGNLFSSPASVSVALAMTYAGAGGPTESEMAATLHFDLPKDQIAAGMAELLASWQASDEKQGFRLDIANRLWGERDFAFLPEFLEVTRTQYGAELATVDFRRNREEARQTINGWVEQETENKISNLIPSADALQDARLVLTNAVYFKGGWSAPFSKGATAKDDFRVSTSQSIKVPLMRQQDEFRYAAADGVQILELPYGDRSLSMIVILPEQTDGLSDLETKLTQDSFENWTGMLTSQEVIVSLPKFKTTCEFELGESLRALGMTSAFDATSADFSGMTAKVELYLSAVFHKAFVDVNEEGTEAAAATGAVMTLASATIDEPVPQVFRADHPFVFAIRDNRNGAILFLGRVVDPTS
jgi:serpin B